MLVLPGVPVPLGEGVQVPGRLPGARRLGEKVPQDPQDPSPCSPANQPLGSAPT